MQAQTNTPPFICSEPDFTGQSGDLYNSCNDILSGKRDILPIDDLAVSQMSFTGDDLSTNVVLLNTENNTISTQSFSQLAAGAPLNSGFNSLNFGRFVNQGVFDTQPTAKQGVVIGPNNNSSGNFCPKAGAGDMLVMNFFRLDGQLDCGALPTDLPFEAAENKAMVWSTVVADFNNDGLDDLFVNYLPDGGYTIFSFEDVDSADITSQMTAVSESKGLFMVDATAGDFDGDGRLEIAGVQNNDGKVQLVILELDFDAMGNISGFMNPVLIDSESINMDFDIESGKTIGITSGDFDTSTPFVEELVVAASLNTEGSLISATLSAFGLNLNGACTPSDTSGCIANLTQNNVNITQGFGIGRAPAPIRLKTKKVLTGPDMAVLGVNSPASLLDSDVSFYNISVLDFNTLDGNLDFSLISTETTINPSNGFTCLHDVAIGNFDPDGDNNPDLMVAALIADSEFAQCSNILSPGSGGNPRIGFYGVNGSELVQTSLFELKGFAATETLPVIDNVTGFMNLEAGDLQGRSLLLGNPTKVIVNNHIQPAVVIKSPPMHVTSLAPKAGENNNVNSQDSTVIGNIITAFPRLFNAEFGLNSALPQSFNQMNTTGYTLSTQEGTELDVSYGIPDDGQINLDFGSTVDQVHNNAVAQRYDQYSELVQGQTLVQRFDDAMLSVHNRLNIWSYPVIGPGGQECAQCGVTSACEGINGCPDGQAPLVVNISAPDMIVVSAGDTANLEWYQPPEVPGNVLTYPWTLAQLEQQFPGYFSLSSQTPEIELAGTSDVPIDVFWTVDNSAADSFQSFVQHSFLTPFSVSGTDGMFPGSGIEAEADFNYHQSNSFTTLFESATTASQTEGFTINNIAVENSTNVQYPFRYYVFGQSSVSGTVHDLVAGDNNFPVSGPLILGFEANPASTNGVFNAGPWWFDTYQSGNSDIALNLPAQWSLMTTEGDAENPRQFRFEKRGDISGLFYYMKSFFAVPATGNLDLCPSSVPGSAPFEFGPQQTTYVDGELMLLCLRVYNLSLSDFPADSVPKVRIYRREWSQDSGNFAQGSSSILIDEITLPLIPKAGADNFGGGSASDAPNWVYASTVFDTTGASLEGDKYWKFWAVTWIENSSGELVEELNDLGLQSIPSESASAHTDVMTESFSNNIGIYNQTFKIVKELSLENPFPEIPDPGPLPNPGPVPLTTRALGDPVFIQSLSSVPGNVVPGDRSVLTLVVNNFDAVPHDVVLFYYDADPELGGKLFDLEIIPQIPSEDTFTVINTFLPVSCGNHNIFVKMAADDGSSDIALANVSRDCAEISITNAFYTPELSQLTVNGTANGVLRGSEVQLFDGRNVIVPIAVIAEEDLGEFNGLSTFKFVLGDIPESLAPCLVKVVSGDVEDQSLVMGKEDCDPDLPPVDPRPTEQPNPTQSPMPTFDPGEPPFDPDDDNVEKVAGVFIVSPEGTMLEDTAQVLSDCPDELNGEFIDYPLEFFTFEVTNIDPGANVEVSLFLPDSVEPVNSYFKFGPTPDNPVPHCYEFNFDGTTGALFLANGEILISFVDGLRGDSDLTANGIITDPGGPVVIRDSTPPQIGVGDCSLARSSRPPSALLSMMIPLLAGLFAGARLFRNRKQNDSQ